MDFVRKAGLMQWALSGALLGSGFIFSFLWPLGIIGIAYFIYLAQQETTYKKVMIGGFVAWTIKSLAASLWFLSVYPMDWPAFLGSKAQLVLVIFYWATYSLWLGVGGVCVAAALKYVWTRVTRKVFLAFFIPTIWLVSELISSFIFAVMTYGEGATITSGFSFGYGGYLLGQHEWLVQLARVGGVYGLSFFAVILALGFLWTTYCQPCKKWYLAPLLFIVFWGSGYIPFVSLTEDAGEYYSVLTIDATFSGLDYRTPEQKKAKKAKLEEAMSAALALEPDYILFPEGIGYFDQTVSIAQEKERFQLLYDNPQAIVVDTGTTQIEGDTVLQSFTYNGLEKTVDVSQKRYLVPQGEFQPGLYAAFLRVLGYGSEVEIIRDDISYTARTSSSQANAASSTPGILYCFESVSPWGVRQIMKERGEVPFIAHPISHGWFNEPHILWRSLDTMLRVQAIWNQQYIVSAGGHAEGKVYTPAGNIRVPENIATGEHWTLRQSFIPIRP